MEWHAWCGLRRVVQLLVRLYGDDNHVATLHDLWSVALITEHENNQYQSSAQIILSNGIIFSWWYEHTHMIMCYIIYDKWNLNCKNSILK